MTADMDVRLAIDTAVLLLYFVIIISIGLYMGRKEESLKDFVLGGRAIPWWVCGSNWRFACLCEAEQRIFESSFWRDAKTSTRDACAPRSYQALLRAGSSVGDNLRFVSERPGDECCPQCLSRVTDHSATEVGMSRHIHLFVDETGGAYSPNFDRAPETIWRATKDRRSARVHVCFAAATCASFGEGIA